MEIPKRIVDDPSADGSVRALLRDAGTETAAPAAKARVLASVGLVAAVGTTSTVGTAAAGAAASNVAGTTMVGASLAAWKLIVPLSVAFIVAGGATWTVTQPTSSPSPSSSSTAVSSSSSPSSPSSPPPPPPESPPAIEPAVAEAPRSVEKRRPPRHLVPRDTAPGALGTADSNAAPVAEKVVSHLAEEALALEAARTALAAHRGTAALSLLDQYEVQHPHGELRPEAMSLRVEALSAAGRRAAARDLGREFLATYPRHPAAARVARIVESNP